MAEAREVLEMLRPQGGWIIRGNDYAGIEYIDCEPIKESEFDAGFAQVDAWKAEQEAAKEAKRKAALVKLEALGLDEDDLKALGL